MFESHNAQLCIRWAHVSAKYAYIMLIVGMETFSLSALSWLVRGPPHGFGIGNPRKYVDVDPQWYPKEISQKMSRASRLPKFFIFFKKTTSVAGTFKKDQVKKFDRVKS